MNSMDAAREQILRITDAAGVPRALAEAHLQREIDTARDRGVIDNDDGSISVPTDDAIARMMAGWGEALAAAYAEQLTPSPKHDRSVSVMENTWVKPEDRVDRDRAAAYPGPFNPRMPLGEAIQYVFQFTDSYYAGVVSGEDRVPRSYTADWLDQIIGAGYAQGLSEIAIVKQLGERVQAIADGYTLMIWEDAAA